MKKFSRKLAKSRGFLALAAMILFVGGLGTLWVASLRLPALESIEERRVDQSTKIYDRTGEILLYDFSQDVRREIVPLEQISSNAINATLAIEDKDFYSHNGFDLSSFLRAIWVNLSTFSFSQGGSTITQQVVKNSILTKDKTPTRKLKELILALKLEKVLSKEDILSLYFNEIPYGGTLYGIEEAAQAFFGKSASDVTLVEGAYLAAIPKAPTYYSPYGSHRDELELRKNLVLLKMEESGFITKEEYEAGALEEVEFKPRSDSASIKAPHFVFYVIEDLVKTYGEEAVRSGGYKVITTLDYPMELEALGLSEKYGEINQDKFNANNNAIVVIDPKTGEIWAMVGSRDYFDKEIDGNFNAATGFRQPGSTFKPFVYSVLFNKGYTDRTILWDIPTQFSTSCGADSLSSEPPCYAPGNYDDKFRGPMTIRNALAQSINIPAVKALYLAGINNSLELAANMGIESLTDTRNYGLSLVLGGGSVSLLDMTSAYGVFANDGVRNPTTAILRVEDAYGRVIDQHTPFPKRVLGEETTRLITSILKDNEARTPGYGANSPLYVPYREVAVKTGTSNDYRDAWILGYSPNLVIGAWVGNNDNSAMEKKVAGLIVSPLWRELMDKILPTLPADNFPDPEPINYPELKPVLRGEATDHSILYWVYKDNPRGVIPPNPSLDSQFNNWESAVRRYSVPQAPVNPLLPGLDQVVPINGEIPVPPATTN